MLTFKQFVTELAREDVTLSPIDVAEMRKRFGDKVLRMGDLQEDGSLRVSVDCILDAASSLKPRTALAEAAEIISNGQAVAMLQSGEALVERVSQARERKLWQMIRAYQNESDGDKSHRQWKEIEKEVFGVYYQD